VADGSSPAAIVIGSAFYWKLLVLGVRDSTIIMNAAQPQWKVRPRDFAARARAPDKDAAMRFQTRRRTIFALGFIAVIAAPTPTQAQWGMGMGGFGWGWGFGGFSQVPKPESYLYQKSLVDAGRAIPTPSRDVYANNPNSYINHLRDNGFVEHYSAARREPSYYRTGSAPRTSPTALRVAQQTLVLPLDSFYGRDGKIEWPGDAPTAGDLSERRAAFETECHTVLDELKKNSVASIATVTEARQKLLDYGRPALHYLRVHETSRVADSFHLFLLSLYESLAQAVNPTVTTGTAPQVAPSS
jgi:hypothetical protein